MKKVDVFGLFRYERKKKKQEIYVNQRLLDKNMRKREDRGRRFSGFC